MDLGTDELFNTELWHFSCIDEITFAWDQWAGCVIRCSHGTYRGVSQGLIDGLKESLHAAVAQFMVDRDQHWYEE